MSSESDRYAKGEKTALRRSPARSAARGNSTIVPIFEQDTGFADTSAHDQPSPSKYHSLFRRANHHFGHKRLARIA